MKTLQTITTPTRISNPQIEALRLRERMEAEAGFNSFSPEEILSTLIGFASRTKRAPQLAANLLDTFGSLKGVLEARPEQLRNVPGIRAKSAAMIGTVIPLVRIWNREAMTEAQRIVNSRDAEQYCLSLLAGRRTEAFYVIALNAQCKLLGVRQISEGSISEVASYPRIVMETALNYNAHSILLTHNHPGGTCCPSTEDINSTLQLKRLLNGVGILLLDHIIVAGKETYSMVQHGDINYR